MEIPSKFDSICVVRVELALDLERELGEALDDLQVLRSNKMSDPLLETTFKNIIRERDEAREALARITEAAQAVVDRWEQPAWKDTEPTAAVIYRLRDALGREAK